MKFNEKKIKAITALPGNERYSHFIKVAADLRSVWGLYQNGWALMHDSEEKPYFPIWPAEPYAAQCAILEWACYQPLEILLDDIFDELIPKIGREGVGICVFPTPNERGVTPDLVNFENDLRKELLRIE